MFAFLLKLKNKFPGEPENVLAIDPVRHSSLGIYLPQMFFVLMACAHFLWKLPLCGWTTVIKWKWPRAKSASVNHRLVLLVVKPQVSVTDGGRGVVGAYRLIKQLIHQISSSSSLVLHRHPLLAVQCFVMHSFSGKVLNWCFVRSIGPEVLDIAKNLQFATVLLNWTNQPFGRIIN